MKLILLISSLFAFVCNFYFTSQNTIKLELEIGDYYDNHSKRIFRYSVQKWYLENDKLITGIDYSDTISVSKIQIEKIIQIIDSQELKKNITLPYNNLTKRKAKHTKKIKAELHLNYQTYFYDMEENVYAILENPDYKNIRVLESYLNTLTKKE